jgi:hypothetical protein
VIPFISDATIQKQIVLMKIMQHCLFVANRFYDTSLLVLLIICYKVLMKFNITYPIRMLKILIFSLQHPRACSSLLHSGNTPENQYKVMNDLSSQLSSQTSQSTFGKGRPTCMLQNHPVQTPDVPQGEQVGGWILK